MTDDDDAFEKAMHDTDWAAVYERQAAHADVVPRLCDLLGLHEGDHVLELGSGPGYTSARLAECVAPGVVYVLDRQLDALRYLREERDAATLGAAAETRSCIRPLVGGAEALPLRFSQPTPTLASLILHHVDAPEDAIEEVAAAVPPSSPVLIVEYYPDASEGPPRDHRIAPERIRQWLSTAGFTLDDTVELSEELYALLAVR